MGKGSNITGMDISIPKQIMDADDKSLSLLEELPAAVYTCDAEGRIMFYNCSAAELWEQNPELEKDMWHKGWKLYEADGLPRPIDESPMAMALKGKGIVASEKIIIERADKIRVDVLPYCKSIFDDYGKITGTINMLVKISEKTGRNTIIIDNVKKINISQLLKRKVDEKTHILKKSEERYHKMIEEVEDYAILLLDRDGNILNWNKGAENIKGYSEKEILGKNFRIFYLDEDRKRKLPEQLITEASERGKAMHEGWRLKKNGDRFWGQIVITALHDQENNIIGFSKVTRDLTERKMAEDQAKSFTRDIEFRNKQLEEYAHIASHDLQEPLRKILTFSELLERNLDDKKLALQNLEKISASAKRMVTLIKDVLQYSQLSLTDDLFSQTDLNLILNNIKKDYELAIEEKNVKIIDFNLPIIKGIPIQLHQLFSNLLGNSLKFSGTDPVIEITSEKAARKEMKQNTPLDSNVSYVKIIFKDNGIGFDPSFADKAFKLFQRLQTALPGTGIGLALCKKIVENHKGFITVTSEPEKGTVFTIYLPE
jgi:PAS domain S-box-containing protein